MAEVTTPTYPNDGEDADAADYNVIIQAILAQVNGNLDKDNISPGSLDWSVMDNFTDSIPAAAMEDEGDLKKYREETGTNFVAEGLVWSATSGLDASMTAGVIYTPDGSRVEPVAVTDREFTASKDTYVDISASGALSYSEVANDGDAPSLASNHTRLAIVVTDGTEVTSVMTSGQDNMGNTIRPTGIVTVAQLGAPIAASVSRSTTQSIPNDTDTPIQFTTEDFDTFNMVDLDDNNTRITIKQAGLYTVTAGVQWSADSSGRRRGMIRLNDTTTLPGGHYNTATNNNPYWHPVLATTRRYEVDDFIELEVYQNSGGSLGVGVADMSIVYHGPAV